MPVMADVALDNAGRLGTHEALGAQSSVIHELSRPAPPLDSYAQWEGADSAGGVGVIVHSPYPLPPAATLVAPVRSEPDPEFVETYKEEFPTVSDVLAAIPDPVLVGAAPSEPDPEFIAKPKDYLAEVRRLFDLLPATLEPAPGESALLEPDPELVVKYKDAREEIQRLRAILAALPSSSSVASSSTSPTTLQERHYTTQAQIDKGTIVGSETTDASFQSNGVPPQAVVIPSDKSPTREHAVFMSESTMPPEQSGHSTADPGTTPKSPTTYPPSKPEQPPERSSNGVSTPLVPPVPEPTSATRVTPAHRPDIASPPESFSRTEVEYPADATPVQLFGRIEQHGTDERQLQTDISSQREEAFVAPMIFDPHRYISKRMSRKVSSPNSVSTDCHSSVFMATGTPPMNVDDACTTGTTTPLQYCIEPCEEGVAVLVAGRGAMKDTSFGDSSEGMESAWESCVVEQPTFPKPGPVSTAASSSNFWNVTPIDIPLPPPQDVGYSM
ncbi:hypothetical protein F5148DRAFT_1163395 [Russula earlei]|uniref:Uncharacterized protein n=1 Tax=Russula earlei TaxID=71964 RepID=A0ACC0UL75_9AGAM|nr:hypothetical protein F5148DRAFT_1163395 [Russula earlei]